MLPALGKLLSLQECDQNTLRLQAELASIEPQRQLLRSKSDAAEAHVETLKQKHRKLETERKQLELDVQAKHQLIERYSLQQFQTRKNEEYRALAHEIEALRTEIARIEDRELELMEEAEATQKAIAEAARGAEQVKRETDKQQADLTGREASLKAHLAGVVQSRQELAAAVDADLLQQYERLRKTKGDRVLVGIEHGVCGGCHVKVPSQVLVHCQAGTEANYCPNCGRILYYTEDMDLTPAE